jgi:geranylgeranyl pyrophosphate synthase
MRLVRPFAPLLRACERRLADVVADHVPQLSDPATATLAAGGKRLRPLLVFCAAPRKRGRDEALVTAATAVELVHMATLVHDYIIDRASLRRGHPTVAQAQGPDVALRVGDFLFARAFSELTRTGDPRAVQALSSAALELSRGEMVQQAAAHDLELSEEAYLSRCRGKTASLFAVACRLGAMVGGADRETEERLAVFGEHVGMAFQIFDDILDLTGSPDATGKPRGTDLRDGTVTLPLILAMQHEPDLAPDIEALGNGGGIEALCDRLAAHPGVVEARERALAFVATARDAVESGLDGVASGALLEIADGVVDRYS